jgi:hypothetical protein
MSGVEIAAWITVVLAAVAIVVAIIVAVWQRQKKELTYEAYAEFPLFAPGPLSGDVEITADGRRLGLPHVLIVTVRNTGNAALRPEDFYSPLEVTLNDAEIITLRLESSLGLRPCGDVTSAAGFTISPLLLNPGEGVVCYGLLDGCPHGVNVSARIADARLRDASRPSFSESLLSRVSLGWGLFGPVMTLTAKKGSHRVPATRTVAPDSDRDL